MGSQHILWVVFVVLMCCLPYSSSMCREGRSAAPRQRQPGFTMDKIRKKKHVGNVSDRAAVHLPGKHVSDIKVGRGGDTSVRRRLRGTTRLRELSGQRKGQEGEEDITMREQMKPITVHEEVGEMPSGAATSSSSLDAKLARGNASESIVVGAKQATGEERVENESESSSSIDNDSSGPLDGEPFFDGVQHCRPVMAADTGEVNRIFDELAQDCEQMLSKWDSQIGPRLGKMEEVLGKESIESDDEFCAAQKIIKMKTEMLLVYQILIQEYTKLKIQGKWSRDHRIASEIYDVRDYLEVVGELEEEFADDIRDFLEQQGEEFAAMEESGSSGNVLEQGGRAIKDTAAEDEENRGAENMASSDSEISDIGEGQEGGVERWQKLLWKAIRFEHEIKIGERKRTKRADELIAKKGYFESMWAASHQDSLKESPDVASRSESGTLRNRLDDTF